MTDPDAVVTFGQIIAVREVSRRHPEDVVRQEATVVERQLRTKFTKQVGTIRNSFFCSTIRGGAAATEAEALNELHTVLNTDNGELLALEDECQNLAEQVRQAFGGQARLTQQRRLFDILYSAMTRVLQIADTLAGLTQADRARALDAAQDEVRRAKVRVTTAIQRQARFVYFQGALIGTVGTLAAAALVGVLAAHLWSAVVSTPAVVGATVFGALGAIVSVFQRISTGALRLDYNAGVGQLRSLGALRPVIGSIFGAVVQFALVSGLLGATGTTTTSPASFGVFALLGFTAGFSERFATDMVERAGQVLAGASREEADAREQQQREQRQRDTSRPSATSNG